MKIKIIALAIILCLILSIGYVFILQKHVLWFYDSFMAFTNENYYQNMYDGWKNKPSSFLLAQLSNFNDEPRFSTAAMILTQRKEAKAIKPLRAILNSHASSKIKRAAIFRLVNFNDKESVDMFIKKAYMYRQMNLDFHDKSQSDLVDEYRDVLQALSSVQSEGIYPLIKELAQYGKKWERGWVLSTCLFYYRDHYEDIIPIYKSAFFGDINKTYSADKAVFIRGLKLLGKAEAIPVLREIAEIEPEYRRDAERAIRSIESLQVK